MINLKSLNKLSSNFLVLAGLLNIDNLGSLCSDIHKVYLQIFINMLSNETYYNHIMDATEHGGIMLKRYTIMTKGRNIPLTILLRNVPGAMAGASFDGSECILFLNIDMLLLYFDDLIKESGDIEDLDIRDSVMNKLDSYLFSVIRHELSHVKYSHQFNDLNKNLQDKLIDYVKFNVGNKIKITNKMLDDLYMAQGKGFAKWQFVTYVRDIEHKLKKHIAEQEIINAPGISNDYKGHLLDIFNESTLPKYYRNINEFHAHANQIVSQLLDEGCDGTSASFKELIGKNKDYLKVIKYLDREDMQKFTKYIYLSLTDTINKVKAQRNP